jgi:DNA-binding NtrC family response regulator
MKILIVDDDNEIHSMMEIFLKNLGHETLHAFNGTEAIKQMVLSEPEIVFLDIRLPDKDGIDVLKEMKEINKKIPVVMITGYKEAEKVIEAFRYGAADCLLKPFNFEYIKNLLPKLKL